MMALHVSRRRSPSSSLINLIMGHHHTSPLRSSHVQQSSSPSRVLRVCAEFLPRIGILPCRVVLCVTGQPDSYTEADYNPMLIATAWHSVVRPANPASRDIARTIFSRHALHNTPPLRWRDTPAQQFHATDFLSAAHRSAPRRVRRVWDWKRSGSGSGGGGGGPFKFGRQFNAIPANYILFGVLGINGVIFAAWTYVQMFQVRPPLIGHAAPPPPYPIKPSGALENRSQQAHLHLSPHAGHTSTAAQRPAASVVVTR